MVQELPQVDKHYTDVRGPMLELIKGLVRINVGQDAYEEDRIANCDAVEHTLRLCRRYNKHLAANVASSSPSRDPRKSAY